MISNKEMENNVKCVSSYFTTCHQGDYIKQMGWAGCVTWRESRKCTNNFGLIFKWTETTWEPDR
jgi:hypothetical protein